MISLGERLDARKGVGPGFDHLRVGLSLAILVWHSFGISYGLTWTRTDPTVAHLRPLIGTMLPMFFALSGFLVMGSALRINNLRTFITFRVLRILPALATEISLSALVVGPILTALPLREYFGDPRFVTYFGSLIGRVSYVLPGLFLSTPLPEVVNGALWTVGPEILCYIIMALFILTTLHLSGRGMLLATAAYLVACIVSDIVLPPAIAEVLPTKTLVLGYLIGNLIYLFRSRLPFSPVYGAAAFGLAVLLLVLAQRGGVAVMAIYPATALLAYVVAVIGLSDLPPLPFFHRGDYSYGIYIFGFPIQQTVAQFTPSMRHWWVNLGIALPITLLFAVASWHIIEKPALGLRKRFLKGAPSNPPKPVFWWGGREWGIAAATVAYGLFVATIADVFPVRRAFTHFASKQPPPGI